MVRTFNDTFLYKGPMIFYFNKLPIDVKYSIILIPFFLIQTCFCFKLSGLRLN